MTDCKLCVHNAVCELWCSQESQNASCYSTDENECSYFNEDNKWIPVKERLPESDTAVIVATDNGMVFQCLYAYDGWDLWDGYMVNITHWMPLPEPPEEVGR